MPFGPYEDHADCVADNQDKDDPDAYCAELERKINAQVRAAKRRALLGIAQEQP